MLWYFGGLNYPKMANQGPPTYFNTFWIIFGTSKKITKSKPVHLFFYVEMLQENQELMETSFKTKNDPKSIGICPGVKISDLGIIKTPNNPKNKFEKQDKKSYKCLPLVALTLNNH